MFPDVGPSSSSPYQLHAYLQQHTQSRDLSRGYIDSLMDEIMERDTKQTRQSCTDEAAAARFDGVGGEGVPRGNGGWH